MHRSFGKKAVVALATLSAAIGLLLWLTRDEGEARAVDGAEGDRIDRADIGRSPTRSPPKLPAPDRVPVAESEVKQAAQLPSSQGDPDIQAIQGYELFERDPEALELIEDGIVASAGEGLLACARQLAGRHELRAYDVVRLHATVDVHASADIGRVERVLDIAFPFE